MRRSIITLLLLIFCLGKLSSQGNILYDRFGKEYYHVFGENVNVRSKADKKGKVITQLQYGDSVKVTKVLESDLTINGLNYPWVEVSLQNGKKTGYLWGGLIAYHHQTFKTDDERSYELYMGPSSYDATDKTLLGEARLLENGKVIDSKTYELLNFNEEAPRLSMGVFVFDWDYFPDWHRNIEFITRISLSMESCGPTGTVYVLAHKGKILFAGSELGSVDGGSFYASNVFVFPWDKGGMKEHIFEYYSHFEEAYEDYPGMDTTYLVNTYSRIDGEFKMNK